MLTAALKALVDRFGLKGETVGEVAAGAVIKHSRDWNLTREAALGCGLASAHARLRRAARLRHEPHHRRAARASHRARRDRVRDRRRRRHDERRADRATVAASRASCSPARAARPSAARLAPWLKLRPRDLKPVDAGRGGAAHRAVDGRALRADGEGVADRPRRAGRARARESSEGGRGVARGLLRRLVAPFAGLATDNNVRSDTSLEKLAALKTVYDRSAAGTLTAGNSTPLTDGASCVLLASEEWARSARAPGAGLSHSFRGGRGRLCRACRSARRTADGADLRGARDARSRRHHAAGLRHLRDPRSVRGAGAVHAQGLGVGAITAARSSSAIGARAPSIDRSSIPKAAASRSGIRSPRPAHGSSPRSRSSSQSAARGAGSSRSAPRAAWASPPFSSADSLAA